MPKSAKSRTLSRAPPSMMQKLAGRAVESLRTSSTEMRVSSLDAELAEESSAAASARAARARRARRAGRPDPPRPLAGATPATRARPARDAPASATGRAAIAQMQRVADIVFMFVCEVRARSVAATRAMSASDAAHHHPRSERLP